MKAEIIVYQCGCRRRWLEIDGATAYDLGFIRKCGKPNHGQPADNIFMPPEVRHEAADVLAYLHEAYHA